MELLNDQALVAPVRFKKPTRLALVAQLIGLGAQLTEPLSLDAVVEQLGCSRRSLIQGCTELMGIGPIELLRAQRLERFTRRCWPAIKSQPHQLLWWETSPSALVFAAVGTSQRPIKSSTANHPVKR